MDVSLERWECRIHLPRLSADEQWRIIDKASDNSDVLALIDPDDVFPELGYSPEQYGKLMAASPELMDFVIQYLYSEHGICAAHHAAAPFSPEQLRDKAQAVLAQIEGSDD